MSLWGWAAIMRQRVSVKRICGTVMCPVDTLLYVLRDVIMLCNA